MSRFLLALAFVLAFINCYIAASTKDGGVDMSRVIGADRCTAIAVGRKGTKDGRYFFFNLKSSYPTFYAIDHISFLF